MKWRKIVRILHRDFGYLAFGLTIIYSISGIAVNHSSDWNPNYIITHDSLKVPPMLDSSLTKDEMVAYVISNLNEKDSVISSFKSSPTVVDIFFDGKSYKADLKTGRIKTEAVEDRAVIRQTNYLHLNAPKKLWTYVADAFAVGELAFVDYAGVKVPYINRLTGEVKEASIFVAALGASSYTYAEAQESERLDCWIRGHINAFDYFEGVPEIVVPDNLKTGVKSPCYYEPEINPTYDDLSIHYGFVVIPARVRKPRDKAKVETAVQVVERWVLAPLRKRTFFSIEEINEAIKPLLDNLNRRQMKHVEKSRRELFESVDKPALKPLPQRPYEYAERKTATVNINYHVGFNKHYYSVPYTLVGSKVEIRATATIVEIFYRGQRVASHLRDDTPGQYSTEDSHMPSNHKRRKEKWSPERFIRWAQSIGPQTCQVIKELLGSKRHPEQAYKSCIGVLKLADKYGPQRLEKACTMANESNLCSYRHIKNILKNNMDKALTQCSSKAYPVFSHEYVRGQHYYQ